MEYRSDKWGTLSAPAGKMGSNLLICSCQLCFCVPSDPGQQTGRGCKPQHSEALFNPYPNMSQSPHGELGQLQLISQVLQ